MAPRILTLTTLSQCLKFCVAFVVYGHHGRYSEMYVNDVLSPMGMLLSGLDENY